MAVTESQLVKNHNSYSVYNYKNSASNPQCFPILFSLYSNENNLIPNHQPNHLYECHKYTMLKIWIRKIGKSGNKCTQHSDSATGN